MTATATKPAKSSPPATTETAPVGLLDQAIERTVERLDGLSRQCLTELNMPGMSAFRRAMVTATAIEVLDKAITPEVLRLILKLMNCPLGFMTDRGPGQKHQDPYDAATVKRCVIEALLNGVDWTGNQFNILAGGKVYITQNGYARKVADVPGLTDLELMPGTPQVLNGHVVVRVGARWKLNGQVRELVDAKGEPGLVFPIATNQGSTADNIVGKAKRKGLKAIFEQATGTRQGEDDDETPLLDQTVRRSERRTRTQEVAGDLAQKAGRKPDEQNQTAAAPTEEQYQQQAPPKEFDGGPDPSAEGGMFGGGGGAGPYAEGR